MIKYHKYKKKLNYQIHIKNLKVNTQDKNPFKNLKKKNFPKYF